MHKNKTHGHRRCSSGNEGRSPTYNSWRNMKYRCYLKSTQSYENYGAKGIAVCDRRKNSFSNFLADMGERPEGMTLDRIDSNSNYEPANCRWATPLEQNRNKRGHKKVQQAA